MRLAVLLTALLLTSCKSAPARKEPAQKEPAQKEPAPQELPFASEIARFERMDEEMPPRPGGIVFVGSSSIRLWSTLEADMAPLQVHNRGFGGSEFSDAIRYADRIITKYQPRAVVVYSGDNDLARRNGKTPQSVAADFETLVARIGHKAPEADIFLLSIKPSPARMQHWQRMAEANALMQAHCDATEGLAFIDVASHLFVGDELRAEPFRPDGIHLNALGYSEWTTRIRSRLAP